VLVAFAAAAWVVRAHQRLAGVTCSLGLITCSALLVHVSGGLIEAHFHFFVVIILLTLYEDWIPFLAAAGYVLLHHGLMGAIDPSSVYNHPDAVAHPFKWAAIHALFVTAAGLAAVVAWRLNEEYRAETEAARGVALRRASAQHAVAELGERALAAGDLHDLFSEAVTTMATVLPVEMAVLTESVADGEEFVVLSAIGMEGGIGMRYPAGRGSQAGYTLLHGKPIIVEDWLDEGRFGRTPILERLGVRSSVSVIVKRREKNFGVLGVLSTIPQRFDDDDISFVQAVANVLSAAIDRVEAEEEVRHRALHDPLTGLPNRVLFIDRLDQALAHTARDGKQVGVLFCDLDQFKLVNDSLGHEAGDELLSAVAPRLRGVLRPGDTVARFGGDEFGILVPDADSVRDVTRVAERVAGALASPFVLRGREHYVTASVGIAIGTGDEASEALIRDADLAMYRAKERGRGHYEIFDQLMRARAVDHLRTENDLRRALERDELRVHYQPMISLASGRAIGFEALVRWQHPERGLLPPAEFIPLAEESGLIVEIGDRVLELACRQAASWQAASPDAPPVGISVNISARQLADRSFPDRVRRVLHESDLQPVCLSLEVTETMLVDEHDGPDDSFRRLKELGVGVVLDDFGTGFSSLGYLRRFPFDLLKIDRSFVDQIGSNSANAAIVNAVTGIAEALGVGVVAEGVETEAQLDAVSALGCHFAQGYLFARPLPPDEAAEFLDAPVFRRDAQSGARGPVRS
jgi:diguanylate cyclase (GGDEF)-like protein